MKSLLAYCQQLLAPYLQGAELLSNNSKWISFPTLKTWRGHSQNIVLLGDAAHTAHFSIGSGTRLAMEDAIALASSLEQHPNLATALNEYELERKPAVEVFQKAAQESQVYFETLKRYLKLAPMQFAFQLLTRSGRISYDDLLASFLSPLTNQHDDEFSGGLPRRIRLWGVITQHSARQIPDFV